MATFRNDNFMSSKASTDVNVVGFAGNALDGILKAIQTSKKAIEDLAGEIGENADDQKKRANSEKVASVASERRQRAAYAAIHGKVDKAISAIDVLKDTLSAALDKLKDVLKDSFKQSLRSFDDFAKQMRGANLSHADKLAAEAAATAAKTIDAGLRVSQESINSALNGIANANYSQFKKLTTITGNAAKDEANAMRLNLIATLQEKRGISAEEALKISSKFSDDNLDAFKYAVLQATEGGSRGERAYAAMKRLLDSPSGQMALSKGDFAANMNRIAEAARRLDSVGAGFSTEFSSKMIEMSTQLQTGMLESVDQGALTTALGIVGGKINSPEQLTDAIGSKLIEIQKLRDSGKIEEAKQLANKMQSSLRPLFEASGNDMGEMINAINDAKAGNLAYREIKTGEEYIEEQAKVHEDNSKNGKFQNLMDNALAGINNLTSGLIDGGIFGSLAVNLDELFGGAITTEDIVTNGFAATIKLLEAIRFGQIINSVGNFLSGAGGGAFLTKLKSVFGIGAGTAGVASVAGNLPDIPDIPDIPGGSNTPDGPNGRGGANARRGARALKGLRTLGVVGAVLGAGLTAAELYSIHSAPDTTVASELSSEKFKEEEKKAQDEIKTAKTVGAVAEAGVAAGGALAGAKIGAMIGAAGGPLGIAAGAIIGTAIGGVGSIVVGNITDSIEKAKNVEIGIKNVKDLEHQLTDLDRLIAAEGDQDTERKRELLELRAQVLKDLQNATKANINTLITNFNSHNEDFANGNADAMSHIAEKIKQTQDALNVNIMKQATGTELSETELSEIEKYKKDLSNLRQAMTGLAGGEFKVEEGESLDDAIKRIAADVRGDGYFDTREDVEYNAAKDQTEMEQFLKQQALDKLTNGVMHEALDDLKQQDVKTIEEFVKQSKLGAGLSEKALRELTGEVIKLAKNDAAYNEWQMKWEQHNANNPTPITFAANGGIFNKATNTIIGEAGKEAVVPLERPDAMRRVLGTLSASEKFKLIKALFNSNSKKLTWDLLASVMLSTLGIGKEVSSGPIIANDEFVKNVLHGAAAQRGKSYAEIVCNQLVEAALKHAGFKTPTTGIVTKHFNHKDMRLVLNDPINGISPNDPKLVPGMILFSHPFTQAEADELNRRKGGKRKAGDPGHMGIYAGNGLWWNSTSSKNTLDYSTGKGIRASDSRGIGVALTKPFRKGTYKLYAAGYYDGMFSASEVSSANVSKNIPYESNVNKAQGILSDAEINEILSEAGVSNSAAMKQYIEQAKQLVVNANSKDDIIAVLLEIARYLKGIAAAPANKPPMMSAARPYTPAYGT